MLRPAHIESIRMSFEEMAQLTTEQLRDIYSAICQELAQRETRDSKEFDADERMAA